MTTPGPDFPVVLDNRTADAAEQLRDALKLAGIHVTAERVADGLTGLHRAIFADALALSDHPSISTGALVVHESAPADLIVLASLPCGVHLLHMMHRDGGWELYGIVPATPGTEHRAWTARSLDIDSSGVHTVSIRK